MTFRLAYFSLFLFLMTNIAGCSKNKETVDSNDNSNVEVTPPKYISLTLDESTSNDLEMEKTGKIIRITTTGADPYIYLTPLVNRIDDNYVLSFEYQLSNALSSFQVFFADPVAESRSLKVAGLTQRNSWKSYALDLGDKMSEFNWGKKGDFLRLDFGDDAGREIQLRKIQLRARTEEEAAKAAEKQQFKEEDQQNDEEIRQYLNRDFNLKINNVRVTNDQITVEGDAKGEEGLVLLETKPFDSYLMLEDDQIVDELPANAFNESIDRFIELSDGKYDRLLSKWAIGKKENNGKITFLSGFHYANEVDAKYSPSTVTLKNKKGLGGFRNDSRMISDLDDLNIGSITINIPITSFTHLTDPGNAYSHTYGGETYYFEKGKINEFDNLLKEAQSRDIAVAGILLVQNASESADPKVGSLLEDLHYQSSAFFTMPSTNNLKSLNCYAAILDFLNDRYGDLNGSYGHISKWIMHNEVDAGTTWTNMGADRPLFVYLDRYYNSMRICYTIAQSYNREIEVLASFTHTWREALGSDYAVLDMLKGLDQFSDVEGDFKWGLAYHSYPEDLNEPKTWNDPNATFSKGSSLVTFKNLEVINQWINQPENEYLGTQKRTLWLSENGTNSRSYSDQDLKEQAAGFAYAWQKIKRLDGIDAIQWHNWMDNRAEFGLRIGLRRFLDDQTAPGGPKPVWHLYQAAGSSSEGSEFEPYKEVIGISNWDDIMRTIP